MVNFDVLWSHGVVVSTLDPESKDPSSNLGGTFHFDFTGYFIFYILLVLYVNLI